MSDEPERTARPALVLKVGGHEIKMTYGLQMDIQRMLPDPAQAINLIMNDPYTQDYVIRRCLTPKNAMIENLEDLISIEDVDIGFDETEDVLNWVVDHALYFFVNRAQRLGITSARYQNLLPNQSTSGSTNSPSTTPSAGPSE